MVTDTELTSVQYDPVTKLAGSNMFARHPTLNMGTYTKVISIYMHFNVYNAYHCNVSMNCNAHYGSNCAP